VKKYKVSPPNVPLTRNTIITLGTSPKSNVKEAILEPLPKNTLILPDFCKQYPNVVFYGASDPPIACQQKI